MTEHEFCMWLAGYLRATQHEDDVNSEHEWHKHIREMLDKVSTEPWDLNKYVKPVDAIGKSWNLQCPVCGLDGAMGYVCPRTDCPTGIVCISTTT